MTIVGVVAFFALWLYAIGTLGVFLGLGAGWIPAAFFAFLLDFAFVAVLGLIATFLSRGDRVVSVSRHFVMPRPSADQLRRIRDLARVVGVIVVGGLLFSGTLYMFRGEIDGSCDRQFEGESEYAAALQWFTSRGATEREVLAASDIDLQLEFGSLATAMREELVAAERVARRSSLSSTTSFCPFSGR